MTELEVLSRFDGSLSLDVAEITPEYPVGECYAASAMGLFRWMDSLMESDADADGDRYCSYACNGIEYCQGWHMRAFPEDGHIDGFAHGFLVDRTGDQPVVIDPLRHRYSSGYVPYWVPIQKWNYRQLADRFEGIEFGKFDAMWPLTISDKRGPVHLEHRLSFQRAFDIAHEAITAEVR